MKKGYDHNKLANIFMYQIITKFSGIFIMIALIVFLYFMFYNKIQNTVQSAKTQIESNVAQPIYPTQEITVPKVEIIAETTTTNVNTEIPSQKEAQKIFYAYELGDYVLASQLIVDFVANYPESPYYNKVRIIGAKLMCQRGDYEGALASIRSVLGATTISNEDYADAVLLMGSIARDRKQYDSYIQTYLEQAYFKATEPVKSKLAFYLGYLLLNKNEYTPSLKYFNQVIGEDGVLGKADLYKAQYMIPERINELENFLKAYPSSKNIDYVKSSLIEDSFSHAKNLLARGYADSACKIYRKVDQHFSGESAGDLAKIRIAEILYSKKEYSRAIAILKEALVSKDTKYDDEVLYKLGTMSFEQDKPQESLGYFRQIVENYPRSSYNTKAKEWINLISESIIN